MVASEVGRFGGPLCLHHVSLACDRVILAALNRLDVIPAPLRNVLSAYGPLPGAPGPVLVTPLTPARLPVSAPPPHASLRVGAPSCALPHARTKGTCVFHRRTVLHALTQPPRPGRRHPGSKIFDVRFLVPRRFKRVARVAPCGPRFVSAR